MQFLKNIKHSIYSPDYYQELLAKPFSYSLKYYFLLVLLISLITATVFSISVAPAAKLFLDAVNNKIVSYYPLDLKIDIKKGQVSTNVVEPYFIKMPEELKNSKDLKINDSEVKNFQNLLVINTKDNFTVEELKSYHTATLLTKDSLVAYSDNGKITISPLDKVSDFSLDKSKVELFVGKVRPFLALVYPVIFLGAWLINIFILLLKFIYLLFGALVIWLVAKLRKMNIGYGKSYQLGIHLMTTGILLEGVMNLFRFYIGPFFTFPFFFTVVLVIMVLINIKKIEPLPNN